ncbi:LOW QUALITY PROTEIN: C-type lectin domain family 4 member G-like [Dasypus novemcinctus]|uniref:LOW QUALITY PROTEIN: C-type lectin domain family 4 member G-like n=1 Tax=Dasypus novemcinctus TaxID=9361 RepID=UPI00265E5273|nr:LOW QUALITY PROTEIN: C-type lectin domain family 4 member G-like [Dasypus novemcinctus]
MDASGYSKWSSAPGEVSSGPWGRWERWGWRPLFVALALVAGIVLWALVLSILFSKASTEHEALLHGQDLLRTNASNQSAVLGALTKETGSCTKCCSEARAQLKTTRADLAEAQKKLLEQESTLKELRERVTQDLAKAGRDRENIRTELFRALEAAQLGNSSCEACPTSWLPFEGSCYLFSTLRAPWDEAQSSCAGAGAHLVIVGGLEEQTFLSQKTRGRGYWLGLRTTRLGSKIQRYQWVDGVQISFSHWNQGEPNDHHGREDCVLMLRTGLWNDVPCTGEKNNWICEKRRHC